MPLVADFFRHDHGG